MKGRVYKRGDRNYALIVEFGFQPAQKCAPCGRQGVFWVAGQRLEACPRCGGQLADIRARRRGWYGSYEHKREAEGKLKDLLGDDGASSSPRSQQTVGEYLLEWSDAIKVRVRPTTVATYATLVRKYVIRWRRLSRNPTHDATRPTPGAGECGRGPPVSSGRSSTT